MRAVSPEPSLLAHTSSESRGTFRQKARSLAPLNGWACAVEICHDGMLEDTNSLDGAQISFKADSTNVGHGENFYNAGVSRGRVFWQSTGLIIGICEPNPLRVITVTFSGVRIFRIFADFSCLVNSEKDIFMCIFHRGTILSLDGISHPGYFSR